MPLPLLRWWVRGGGGGANSNNTPADSWAVGLELQEDHSSSWLSFSQIETPLTPALVALSPGATPRYNAGAAPHNSSASPNFYDEDDDDRENRHLDGAPDHEYYYHHHHQDGDLKAAPPAYDDDDDDEDRMEELLRERRRRWAQEKITHAVFAHPQSLRSFCWDAYQAANDIRMQKQQQAAAAAAAAMQVVDAESPETLIEPTTTTTTTMVHSNTNKKQKQRKKMDLRAKLVHELIDWIFHTVPVSVLLDVLEALGLTTLDTAGASIHIAIASPQHALGALGRVICAVWEGLKHCVSNPFAVLEAIISLQFNAMGKTSEVLVSGIQSVATGVGSASSLALYRLSTTTANMSSQPSFVTGGKQLYGGAQHHDMNNSKSGVLSKRLLRKLSNISDAALVVEYRESGESTGGLTRHAVSRTRRMMHYSVSLRPFVATIALPAEKTRRPSDGSHSSSSSAGGNSTSHSPPQEPPFAAVDADADDDHHHHPMVLRRDSYSMKSSSEEDESPFMCTPQSFPPTPHSRQRLIARRSQMSDDVVFLARDRLRVHGGLESENARTRERSLALIEGKCLAIFSRDKESGIELTCGQHIASKVNDSYYYASTRSLVSILRNCFVYFELTVLPRPDIPYHNAVATLSVGLSTAEMPANTLVGAWQGSVGLCTTGQILMAGQWCSPADPALCAYGVGATVGCLVYLDDESAFETWDGVMVKAKVRLNVNGVMVPPPVSTLPMSGAPSATPIESPAGVVMGGSLGSVGTGSGERMSPSPATLHSPPASLSSNNSNNNKARGIVFVRSRGGDAPPARTVGGRPVSHRDAAEFGHLGGVPLFERRRAGDDARRYGSPRRCGRVWGRRQRHSEREPRFDQSFAFVVIHNYVVSRLNRFCIHAVLAVIYYINCII